MDYIREELERQRAALAALLRSGGQETEEPRRNGAEETGPEMAGFFGTAARTAERGWIFAGESLPAAEGETALRRLAGGVTAETAISGGGGRSAETSAAGWTRERAETADGGRTGAGGGMAGPAAAPRAVETVQWVTAPAETLGPEELSRAVERDARRYDGGFRLY